MFAGLAWAIWKNRNKMAIEKCFPLNPDGIIHMAIIFLQMWADLHKESDKNKMKGMVQCIADWMSQKKGVEESCSEIVMI